MQQRFDIGALEPEAYTAMMGLEKYLAKSRMDKGLKHLVKVRASQINGCAYCIQMHAQEARAAGETELRIYALSAWKESPLFNDKERAILAMTDEVTLISQAGLTEATYQLLQEHFNEHEIAQFMMLLVTINAWNRIAVSSHTHYPNE